MVCCLSELSVLVLSLHKGYAAYGKSCQGVSAQFESRVPCVAGNFPIRANIGMRPFASYGRTARPRELPDVRAAVFGTAPCATGSIGVEGDGKRPGGTASLPCADDGTVAAAARVAVVITLAGREAHAQHCCHHDGQQMPQKFSSFHCFG